MDSAILSDENNINIAITQTIRNSYRQLHHGLHPWIQAVRGYVDLRTKLAKLSKKYQVKYMIVIELHDNLDVHFHSLACMKKSNKRHFEIMYKGLFDEVGNYKLKTCTDIQGWIDYLYKDDKKDVKEFLPLTSKVLLDEFKLKEVDTTLENRYLAYKYFLEQDDNEPVEGGSTLKYYFDARGLRREYESRIK